MAASPLTPTASPDAPATPWWRVRMVWLVIAGPAIVVVASLFTAGIAIRGADPVLTREDPQVEATRGKPSDALTPAVQARNQGANVAASAP